MYIVFKNLDDWFAKNSGLKERFENTETVVLKAIREYASNLRKEIIEKTKFKIKVNISEVLLKQALIDAYDDLMRLTNYHFTDNPNPIKEMSYIVYWLIKRKAITLTTEEIIYNTCLSEMARVKMIFLNEAFCVKLLMGAAFPNQTKRKDGGDLTENGIKQLKYYKRYLLYYLVYRLESAKSLEAEMLALTVDPSYEVDTIIWNNPPDPSEDY